jgi:predicted transcriptional regulator
MADGGMTVNIDEALAARVRAAAKAAGVSVETLVAEMLARQLFSYGDYDWDADLNPQVDLEVAEAAERDGDFVPSDEAVRWMRSWFSTDETSPPVPRPRA